jgi:N-acetyl-gamma-glutamyl-phosphate reductase common form
MSMSTPKKRIGLVGARGHVGRELLKLLEADERSHVSFVSSKGGAGKLAKDAIGAVGRFADLELEDLDPADIVRRGVDGVILGLPNGASAPWLAAIPPSVRVVDLSADLRFDDSGDVVYGLTEKYRSQIKGARRIANPGCYATAAQLAMLPFEADIARAQIFGVSGFSGAGSTPSPKNDPENLRDNILPYDLVNHTQEREMTRHSGVDVSFMPHVAPFFRGISVTVSLDLKRSISADDAFAMLAERYAKEALVHVLPGPMPPTVAQVRGNNRVIIGGVHAKISKQRLVVVAVIDNLLKGAATQAVQNMHLMLDEPELSGITV